MSPSSPERDPALPAAAAVGEVLAAADLAIDAVAASARSQVVELETTFEKRLVEESVKRRAGLGVLRVELAERAARLAAAYAETAEQLGEIDAALRQLGEPAALRAEAERAEAPPVKITLRERRTHFGGIEPRQEEASTELFGGQAEPEAAPRPRRSWRIWQRNAA